MSGIIIVGSQWGDEGKGKIVDVFSAQSDFVVRYHGGSNAGHTLNVNGKKTVLHLIPSGILHDNVQCVIAAGVALDVQGAVKEIEQLKAAGYLQNPKQLLISESASLLLDDHPALDKAREERAGKSKIGTTGKGIGPAYEARSARKSLIFSDLFLSDADLQDKVEKASAETRFLLQEYYKVEAPTTRQILDNLKKVRPFLQDYRCSNASSVIHQALEQKKKVLFEGAQGTLLDLLHGTYPYVTSSSTLAGAALSYCGIGWSHIRKVIGITKAYTTRVGEGPFPSECHHAEAKHLEIKGMEKGSTTSRPRRCGWLDLVALKYAIRVNGITHLALMKGDVLSGLKKIKVCTGYKYKGQILQEYPVHFHILKSCEPIYTEFEGWDQELQDVRDIEDLPEQFRTYIGFIEKELNITCSMISIGPQRDETIWLQPLF